MQHVYIYTYMYILQYFFTIFNIVVRFVGYKFRLGEDRSDDEEGLTLGLGIHLTLGKRLLALDYVYADFGHLQQAHRVTKILAHKLKSICV